DEPTAGLDPKGQQEVMDMFYQIHEQEQSTMILVTHRMEDALQYADHIIILSNGEHFLEGTPEDIFQQEESIRSVQLQFPESIQFIKKLNAKIVANLQLKRQTINKITQQNKTNTKKTNKT